MAIASEYVSTKSGYKLHIVSTEKYKTNTLVLKLKAPLEKETATLRALLPYVLQSKTAKYPTTSAFRSYLDDLYGAGFYVDVAKKGEYHVVSFTIEIVNEKFLSDQTPLLEKAFSLLTEVLFNPKIEADGLDSTTVLNEKRALKQRIQSVFDDKMRYSQTRLVEEMCEGEPYALDANGILDDVDKITPQSLYEYYQQTFRDDEIDLYVIGDITTSQVEQLADKYIILPEREPVKIQRQAQHRNDPKEIIEKMDVKQGKLNIGYRTNVYYGEKEYYALQLFNGLFGGFSHSKLFINVREKASLAYYAASRLESHKGLMMVMSGIENAKYEQALTIIKEQLVAMQNGDFTEEELQQTKAVVKNQLLEMIDVPRGLVEILYHNVIANSTISLDEWLIKADEPTKEDVMAVAKKIELDTIYFLAGSEV